MDIRNIFTAVSDQLLSEFRKTLGVTHPVGRGDLREGAFRDFLHEYLPTRYGVGRGQVITPNNAASGQLDIVIFDPLHCPTLITSPSHSIYPIESVYGAISMKSTLGSEELKDGYRNIASLKTILPQHGFTHKPTDGFSIGMSRPMPVTGIIAYGSNRSLEAIAAQVATLDRESSDISLRPDFVAVIGQGIVAAREPLRGEFNHYTLPNDLERLAELRKTGRHTLLRLYMQILRELNALTLRPLDLDVYDNMPRMVGPYRIGPRDRFVKFPLDRPGEKRVMRFTERGIEEVVRNSAPVTFQQHMIHLLGPLAPNAQDAGLDPNRIIYEYNPNNLPPLDPSKIRMTEEGGAVSDVPAYQPLSLNIDGKNYAIDLFSLTDNCLEEDSDFTVDELMSR